MTCSNLCSASLAICTQFSGVTGSIGDRVSVELYHINWSRAWLASGSIYFGPLAMVGTICVLGNVSDLVIFYFN